STSSSVSMPASILKARRSRPPPGCPPGLPPLLREFESPDDDDDDHDDDSQQSHDSEEEEKETKERGKKRIRFSDEPTSNLSDFLKEIEQIEGAKDSTKKAVVEEPVMGPNSNLNAKNPNPI